MSNILLISGHPNLEQSYANTIIIGGVSKSIPHINIRKLDELYPTYNIDVVAEQNELIKADIIILQFPLHWYSVPALLKKWIDVVFEFNFAYGPSGDKLKGKSIFISFTIGGSKESYSPLEYNHFSVEEILKPLQQTMYLAGLQYHKPIYTHSMSFRPGIFGSREEVERKALIHAEMLVSRIKQKLISQ